MNSFDQAFAIVIGHEGGYDANRDDPGDWTGGARGSGALRGTKFGISAAAYPTLDIAALTEADAREIYRRDYWSRITGDRLPPPLALLVFDAAVNNGPSRAATWLQDAVGAVADGMIGDQTLGAVTAYLATKGGAALCGEYLALRMAFMATLPGWRLFGLGWARRLCAMPYQSLTMSGGS